jgi:DNA-binding response OmpR family regulator
MKTVFLVHDEQESPTIRQNWLEAAGFTVKLMTSGNQLHSALEKESPGLVVLDVLLEGKNGFEVCQDVHLKHRQRAFPLVLCTHIYRARQFRDEALRFGERLSAPADGVRGLPGAHRRGHEGLP